jgi:hypothetical protein
LSESDAAHHERALVVQELPGLCGRVCVVVLLAFYRRYEVVLRPCPEIVIGHNLGGEVRNIENVRSYFLNFFLVYSRIGAVSGEQDLDKPGLVVVGVRVRLGVGHNELNPNEAGVDDYVEDGLFGLVLLDSLLTHLLQFLLAQCVQVEAVFEIGKLSSEFVPLEK